MTDPDAPQRRILSADDARDSVDCGNGLDSVLGDALDWLSTTCENV